MINKFPFLDDFVVCLYEEIIKLSDCLEYPTRDSVSLCSCYLSRMWRRSWMTHRRLLNINRLLTVVVMLLLYLKASTCNMLGNVKLNISCIFAPCSSGPVKHSDSYVDSIAVETSTIVSYRTLVYQMQPRNGQNGHSSVGKYVHHNHETAKIGFCTSLKSIAISGFVDTRDKVNAN